LDVALRFVRDDAKADPSYDSENNKVSQRKPRQEKEQKRHRNDYEGGSQVGLLENQCNGNQCEQTGNQNMPTIFKVPRKSFAEKIAKGEEQSDFCKFGRLYLKTQHLNPASSVVDLCAFLENPNQREKDSAIKNPPFSGEPVIID
jgi:hypothetical protein